MVGLVHRRRDVGRPHCIADDAHERRRIPQGIRGIVARALADGANHRVARNKVLLPLPVRNDKATALYAHTAGVQVDVDARALDFRKQDGPMADVGVDGKPVAHLDDVRTPTDSHLVDRAFAARQPTAKNDNLIPRLFAFQVQVVDREHARTLFDGKRHRNRSRPHGDNRRIGRNPLRERRVDLGIQPNVHPKAIEQMRVGAPQLIHVAFKGQRRLGAQDATELALALAQDDVVPTTGRRCRGDHASDAAAHDEHLARTGRARDVHPLELAPDERVYRAAARLRHGTLGHAHVAAKAFHHVIAAICHHLRG